MKIKLDKVARVLSGFVLAIVAVVVVLTAFWVGFSRGFIFGKNEQIASATTIPAATSKPVTKVVYVTPVPDPKVTWGGPQLWEAVNKRRVELGVDPLKSESEICTIASARLNEILKLGALDAHAGFSKLAQREDLKPTFEKYNLSEFLVSGADSPQDAVSLWENTLGHKELLNGGQYVWGCIYAQNGFGVAIAAY